MHKILNKEKWQLLSWLFFWSNDTQSSFIMGISRLLELWNYLIVLIWLQEEARALAVSARETLLARALAAFFPAASAGFFLSSFSNYSMNLHNFHELIECVVCIEHWLRFISKHVVRKRRKMYLGRGNAESN